MRIAAPRLEIAVQDPAGARTAIAAGADRVELCQALSGTGGLTPSAAAVDAVRAVVERPERLAVLIRPRPGGFVYDEEEIALTAVDIADVVRRGAGGVVIGALTRDGRIDHRALARWRAAAGEAEFVFHRAIDTLPDPRAVIDDLVDAGVDRILTSGGAVRSIDGAVVLAGLVDEAAGRLQIMAGGGVRVQDIPALLATGVHDVHLSAKAPSRDVAPTGPGGGGAGFDVTDGETVRAAARAVHGAEGITPG